ncbi:secreted protein [Streptomyces hygroscopicus subsp. jinggangensis 5008]|nr:secreted protein [Streptomyces hygroscopicus subsp. jinggangensis 5008]AGF64969.1 secreted protein [Streptomyces hygroscopicus subsp. jinggangensis TL01]
MFSEATVLRALAAAAAATAVVGAVVMRRWDAQAGKQVAELTRARAGDEWRHEERVAELETDLEESRELRAKLEQRLRAKRAELAGLRNEHAALLRRYATAETERASALEGRRLLEIEAAVPEPEPAPSARALPPARGAEPVAAASSEVSGTEERPAAFSPGGAQLYRRALTALARFDRQGPDQGEDGVEADAGAEGDEPEAAEVRAARLASAESAEPADATEAAGAAVAAESAEVADSAASVAVASETSGPEAHPAPGEAAADTAPEAAPEAADDAPEAAVAKGEPAADGVKEGADPAPATEAAPPVGRPPAGHFAVPTAVAVLPAAPARRPVVEGGFDFFGTQKGAPKTTLDSVQNEDLADVVGPEALAVHKAESEAGFKAVDARSREVGQVIDLTAHDETEQIDIEGLRSAAS